MIARTLQSYAGREGPFDEAAIHSLPTATRRRLEAELESAIPEFDLGMDVRCHACAAEFATPFEISSFFLLS